MYHTVPGQRDPVLHASLPQANWTGRAHRMKPPGQRAAAAGQTAGGPNTPSAPDHRQTAASAAQWNEKQEPGRQWHRWRRAVGETSWRGSCTAIGSCKPTAIASRFTRRNSLTGADRAAPAAGTAARRRPRHAIRPLAPVLRTERRLVPAAIAIAHDQLPPPKRRR